MARRRKKFDLEILSSVTEDLRLPGLLLDPPRLDGYAYWFKLILPLLSATGEEVFTDYHLRILHELFDRRCGGSLASASVSEERASSAILRVCLPPVTVRNSTSRPGRQVLPGRVFSRGHEASEIPDADC